MSNLIDRDKLIDKLKQYSNDICVSLWNDIVCLINTQPTVNEWIPVSERLPDLRELDTEFEDFTKMLLTTDGTDFDIAWFDISEQIWESNGKGFVVEPKDIIAWQPILEYKGGDE